MNFCAEAKAVKTPHEVLQYALDNVKLKGLYLELGVFQGDSITFIASIISSQTIYGFDSFEGLPEDWFRGGPRNFPKGCFAFPEYETLYENLPSNVVLVKGLFEDTLPKFVQTVGLQKPIAFIHIDCDIYSSTGCAFRGLEKLIQTGTVIVFDELYGYPGFENHELKAFLEFLERSSLKAEALAYCVDNEQVAVRIL